MQSGRLIAGFLAAVGVGCSGNTPSAPNPFTSADRVAPPSPQVATPGAPAPYYQGQAAPVGTPPGAAPGFGAPPAGAYPPSLNAAPYSTPGATPPPGSATPVYGPPGSQGSASRGAPTTNQFAGGDTIAVPTDNGSIRFRSPNPPPNSQVEGTAVASTGAGTRAPASGWIAGSAPVGSSGTSTPRVRMPGELLPTEPARVATPTTTTGWR